MSHAERCPVCGGSGKFPDNPYEFGIPNSTLVSPSLKTCHGCGGTGWVTVGNDDVPFIPPKPQK